MRTHDAHMETHICDRTHTPPDITQLTGLAIAIRADSWDGATTSYSYTFDTNSAWQINYGRPVQERRARIASSYSSFSPLSLYSPHRFTHLELVCVRARVCAVGMGDGQ